MTYQGQLIQQFKIRSGVASFVENQRQLLLLLRVILGVLVVIGLLTAVIQFNDLEFADVLLFLLLMGVLLQFTRWISKRISQISQEGSAFQEFLIMEYGLQLPPIFGEESIFLTYNDVNEIAIMENYALIKSGPQEFVVDYALLQHENIELCAQLLLRIKTKLASVENRDHPTVIPRLYFRDLLEEN